MHCTNTMHKYKVLRQIAFEKDKSLFSEADRQKSFAWNYDLPATYIPHNFLTKVGLRYRPIRKQTLGIKHSYKLQCIRLYTKHDLVNRSNQKVLTRYNICLRQTMSAVRRIRIPVTLNNVIDLLYGDRALACLSNYIIVGLLYSSTLFFRAPIEKHDSQIPCLTQPVIQ